MEIAQTASVPKRALALDALRGLAILMMVFCSVIPFGVLPGWMYHAQTPPPSHDFIPVPGLTWVDLVFPFFLFSMGAAFPLALSKKIKSGQYASLAGQVALRAVLLAGFGIYLEHIRPFVLNPNKTIYTWLTALFGFVMLFSVLTRFPKTWKSSTCWTIRLSGLLVMAGLLFFIRYPDGSGFSLYRSDIIIMFLSAMAWAGSLIYVLTRSSILLRMGVIGVMLAIQLSFDVDGSWVRQAVPAFPLPWLFDWPHLRYLFVVLPGTVAGDLISEWMNGPDLKPENLPLSRARLVIFSALMLALQVAMIVGVHARHVGQTAFVCACLCVAAYLLIRDAVTSTEKLVKSLFLWGVFWLFLGLILEPYQGGLKKDPPTLSYYFCASGLALFVLSAFTVISDIFKKGRYVSLLVDNGQNPMIAYAASANFVSCVLAIFGLDRLLSAVAVTPWLGVARGALETLIAAYFVSFFTRRRIFWRT